MFESTRLAALKELLDRALGRPAQMVQGNADAPLVVRFQWASALEPAPSSAEQANTDGQLVITTEWSDVERPAQDTSGALDPDEG